MSGISYIFEIIPIFYALKRSKTEKGVAGSTLRRTAVLLSIAALASFVQYLYVDILLILKLDWFPTNEFGFVCVIILLDIVPVSVILITFYRIPPIRKSEVIIRGTEMQKPLLEKNDPENPLTHTESPITKKVGKIEKLEKSEKNEKNRNF